MATPASFRDAVKEDEIEVLPLVDEAGKDRQPGWCTYTYVYDELPEMEVICGGVNSKTAKAGAVWRQGNLLHFGFEQSPAEMNDAGRAMLVNSIAYIARFTDDRPIGRTQYFKSTPRSSIDRILRRDLSYDLEFLKHLMSPELFESLVAPTERDPGDLKSPFTREQRDKVQGVFAELRGFLTVNSDGKLAVDEDARTFGIAPSAAQFIESAARALAGGPRESLARRLLARYVPDGPGQSASADQWRSWRQQNGPYLFFADAAGYRWYIDPLAQKRGVPTVQLRGPKRANLKHD